jgi:anti-sigma regulatory factor (Ser/Thr protein kinase)
MSEGAVMSSFESPDSFRLSLVPSRTAPTEARRALEGISTRLDHDLSERAGLVISELVTNSLKHADLSEPQRIELSVSVRPEFVRIDVTDPGDGFEPVALRPGDDENGVGGWGLWVVDQLTDRWGVDFSHSTHVWCEFDRA